MAGPTAEKALEELTLGKGFVLEDLVEREELGELAKRSADLFGLSVRILSHSGALLADSSSVRFGTTVASISPPCGSRTNAVTDVLGLPEVAGSGNSRARTSSALIVWDMVFLCDSLGMGKT